MKLKKPVKAVLMYNHLADAWSAIETIINYDCVIKPMYPKSDENGWIKVTDRKPTKKDANKDEKVIALSVNGFMSFELYFNALFDCGLITHWMPAPKLPKKKK